jgi:hypothetical protein
MIRASPQKRKKEEKNLTPHAFKAINIFAAI